jgi:hypothetical protein
MCATLDTCLINVQYNCSTLTNISQHFEKSTFETCHMAKSVVAHCRFHDLLQVNWRITRSVYAVIGAYHDSSFVPDPGPCHAVAKS